MPSHSFFVSALLVKEMELDEKIGTCRKAGTCVFVHSSFHDIRCKWQTPSKTVVKQSYNKRIEIEHVLADLRVRRRAMLR